MILQSLLIKRTQPKGGIAAFCHCLAQLQQLFKCQWLGWRDRCAVIEYCQFHVAAEKKVIVNAVDIYQSNFGTITINLSTIMNSAHADKVLIFGDMNLWNLAWLRPINYEKLYRSGGATRYMIEAEYAVECLQEKGSGKIDIA